jgi:preprotein translocase subunit YajC
MIILEEVIKMFNQLTTTATNDPYSWLYTIGMVVVLFVVFYFFAIRPQKKQEKQAKEMRDSLKIGDEITTIGGIIGKIISIKDETVMIESGHDRTKIRILKSAISKIDVHAEDADQ